MNYFELYNIPLSLKINLAEIKKKFYQLSREFHPDFFSQSSEAERLFALEQSALINTAYKTFCNEDELVKYVLYLKGLLAEDEKYQLPQNFLFEIMDLNEQLMDATLDSNQAELEKIKSELLLLKDNLYEPINSIIENYQEGITSQEALLQVKEYYFKKKYLDKITESSN